jgi:hypothetical protein
VGVLWKLKASFCNNIRERRNLPIKKNNFARVGRRVEECIGGEIYAKLDKSRRFDA